MGRDWWRRIWRVRAGATVWTGLTRVGYFLLFVVPSGAIDLQFTNDDRLRLFGLAVAFAAVASPITYRLGKRRFAPVAAWLDSGEPPTTEQRAELLAVPWRHAGGTLQYWAAAGVVAGVMYAVLFEPDPGGIVGLVLGVNLLGLHAAAFVYLLVERLIRPLVTQAVSATEAVRLHVVSVRNRFLLAWALGPGVSLAGIGILLSISHSDSGDLAVAIWPIIVLALSEGIVLVYGAAASVTEPMQDIREAMKRVSDGDLEAEVPIHATSEVGLLQIGFNQMLGGLRERGRLRQLLGEYAGDDVAERLIDRGTDFRGTKVDASVLMVDLIGSTPLAETESGEEVLATLNTMFDAVISAVAEHGGWVNRFVGDAAVCVFGAPTSQTDHADRALRAARDLHAELVRLRGDRPWLDAGLGVSSGSLIAATVGSETRHEFTVVGDPANEAARLTELAKQRSARVLASGATVDRSGTEVAHWRHAGETVLRGRSHPTALFEPVDAIAVLRDAGGAGSSA